MAWGIAGAALLAWLFLVFGRGRYWLADQRLVETETARESWPGVVALVPARNEASLIAETLPTLLDQDYPGFFRIVLIDDESDDGTAKLARELAHGHPRGHRLEVVEAPPRPAGWVGKMWALDCGFGSALEADWPFAFTWQSDADIAHGPGTLSRLVAKSLEDERALVSLMVKLDGDGEAAGLWEAFLLPAFVYFFQKLYPFAWVNDAKTRMAAAAGGCVLARRDVMERIGAFSVIRGEIIDDCALAVRVKREGPLWLGLSESSRSVRPYGGLDGIWEMVVRSAFTELRYSWWRLFGTVLGLLWLYLVPVASVVTLAWHRDLGLAALGAAAWALAAITFLPSLALYRRSLLWAPALPAAALLYAAMTVDSARRHARREGAAWKGRTMAGRGESS